MHNTVRGIRAHYEPNYTRKIALNNSNLAVEKTQIETTVTTCRPTPFILKGAAEYRSVSIRVITGEPMPNLSRPNCLLCHPICLESRASKTYAINLLTQNSCVKALLYNCPLCWTVIWISNMFSKRKKSIIFWRYLRPIMAEVVATSMLVFNICSTPTTSSYRMANLQDK